MQKCVTTKFTLISCVTVSSYMTLESGPYQTSKILPRRRSGEKTTFGHIELLSTANKKEMKVVGCNEFLCKALRTIVVTFPDQHFPFPFHP